MFENIYADIQYLIFLFTFFWGSHAFRGRSHLTGGLRPDSLRLGHRLTDIQTGMKTLYDINST